MADVRAVGDRIARSPFMAREVATTAGRWGRSRSAPRVTAALALLAPAAILRLQEIDAVVV